PEATKATLAEIARQISAATGDQAPVPEAEVEVPLPVASDQVEASGPDSQPANENGLPSIRDQPTALEASPRPAESISADDRSTVVAPAAAESAPEAPADRTLRPAAFLPSAFSLGKETRERMPLDTSILEQLPVPVLIHSGDVLHYANGE